MSIIEELEIIARDAQSQVQGCAMMAVLWLLSVTVVILASVILGRQLEKVLRWTKSHKLETVWLAPFVIAMIYTGSTKPGSVSYPYTDIEQRYMIDAGSYVTNDYVHVAFTKSTLVPNTAEVWGAVRPAGNTNDEDWVIFLESTFEKFVSPTNVPYAGAETNNFQFFTSWTPGPTVHTNGVAVIYWQVGMAGETNKFVTLRTGIYKDGLRIAPNEGMTNGPALNVSVKTISNEE